MVINRTKHRVQWSVTTIFSLCTLLFCCSARDVITPNLPIRDALNETLVSAGKIFELGFFFPPGSSKRYLGIWHYRSKVKVWVVANREASLVHGEDGVFGIGKDGNLHIFEDSEKSIWSTGLKSRSPMNLTAKLMDSGNLVLINMDPSSPLWQSFGYPTDTFLPGMMFNENMNLSSWNGRDDPESGDFKFTLEPGRGKMIYYAVTNRSITYWRSTDQSPKFFNQSETSQHKVILPNNTRLVMNYTGEIQLWIWDEKKGQWSLTWFEPSNRCSVFNACQNFGVCDLNSKFGCKCLPGFVPDSPDRWHSRDFSGGCKRQLGFCEKNNTNFLSLKMMKVEKAGSSTSDRNETECKKECLNSCTCQAYSYDGAQGGFQRPGSNIPSCRIWTDDLKNLEEYSNGGLNLYVRVPLSDIASASTSRSCYTCGTNTIPYPLSTGPNCGDPLYFSFECNNNTGQVTFTAPSGHTYQVTRVNPDEQNFVIDGSNNCNSGISSSVDDFNFLQLNQSSPFHVTNRCNAENETEIAWKPAGEPTCRSSTDCRDWPQSTCNGTGDGKRCFCSPNFKWNAARLNCTESDPHLSSIPTQTKGKAASVPLIVGLTIASAIVLLNTSVVIYIWRRKVAKKRENSENIQGNLARRFYGSERRLKQLMDSGEFTEEDKKDIDVPYFDFESILTATDSFSDVNKLGQGGYGPVYKGTFPGDHEIAVKRLLSVSGQGLQEFKNEVVLIAKLQHRNLVKLLGYCVKGDEKILLYEYMPNKSLDSFVFDNMRSLLLNWNIRFNIILGIARGLLYLHQDSRLRVIHRDLKTSNILLDDEMNPKISDFGLARIVGGKQIEASTNRIVGTYGYMSPEYALEGLFSVKSDVFSFGVVVLEIISGKRNTGFYRSQQALSLLGHTWKLWKEEKLLDLMDPILYQTYNADEFLRCISVGLLCVQEDPSDRPTMSNVLFMLGSDAATLPTPKQPAFVVRRGFSSTHSSSSKQDTITEVPSTLEEGR